MSIQRFDREKNAKFMRKATKTSPQSLAEKRAKVVPRYGAADNKLVPVHLLTTVTLHSKCTLLRQPLRKKKLRFERNVIFGDFFLIFKISPILALHSSYFFPRSFCGNVFFQFNEII